MYPSSCSNVNGNPFGLDFKFFITHSVMLYHQMQVRLKREHLNVAKFEPEYGLDPMLDIALVGSEWQFRIQGRASNWQDKLVVTSTRSVEQDALSPTEVKKTPSSIQQKNKILGCRRANPSCCRGKEIRGEVYTEALKRNNYSVKYKFAAGSKICIV